MNTDVYLDAEDGTVVLINSRVMKVTASDFILDAPSRRRQHDPHERQHRRALVHDHSDGLTINFNSDYPGGVTIHDVVNLTNKRSVGMTIEGVAEISAHPRLKAAGSDGGQEQVGSLTIRGSILIESDISTNLPADKENRDQGNTRLISLQSLLTAMQKELSHLREEVAILRQSKT